MLTAMMSDRAARQSHLAFYGPWQAAENGEAEARAILERTEPISHPDGFIGSRWGGTFLQGDGRYSSFYVDTIPWKGGDSGLDIDERRALAESLAAALPLLDAMEAEARSA